MRRRSHNLQTLILVIGLLPIAVCERCSKQGGIVDNGDHPGGSDGNPQPDVGNPAATVPTATYIGGVSIVLPVDFAKVELDKTHGVFKFNDYWIDLKIDSTICEGVAPIENKYKTQVYKCGSHLWQFKTQKGVILTMEYHLTDTQLSEVGASVQDAPNSIPASPWIEE